MREFIAHFNKTTFFTRILNSTSPIAHKFAIIESTLILRIIRDLVLIATLWVILKIYALLKIVANGKLDKYFSISLN